MQRIDKWLWHARVVRTRSDAAVLTEAGHVRLNGRRTTAPGHRLRRGDVVTVALDHSVRVLQVEAFSERREAAAAARMLYRDLTASSGPKASPKPSLKPSLKPCVCKTASRMVSPPI